VVTPFYPKFQAGPSAESKSGCSISNIHSRRQQWVSTFWPPHFPVVEERVELPFIWGCSLSITYRPATPNYRRSSSQAKQNQIRIWHHKCYSRAVGRTKNRAARALQTQARPLRGPARARGRALSPPTRPAGSAPCPLRSRLVWLDALIASKKNPKKCWKNPMDLLTNSKNFGLKMRSMEAFSDLAAGSSRTEANRSLTSCIPAANFGLASI
jgi:hypothetical protein